MHLGEIELRSIDLNRRSNDRLQTFQPSVKIPPVTKRSPPCDSSNSARNTLLVRPLIARAQVSRKFGDRCAQTIVGTRISLVYWLKTKFPAEDADNEDSWRVCLSCVFAMLIYSPLSLSLETEHIYIYIFKKFVTLIIRLILNNFLYLSMISKEIETRKGSTLPSRK